MKKYLSLIVSLLMIAQLLCVAVAATPAEYDAVFSIGSAKGAPGEKVSFELSIESKVEWNSLAVSEITYDPELLTFAGFANYDAIAEKAFLKSFDADKGAIVIALNPAEAYSAKICDLVFTVNTNAKV